MKTFLVNYQHGDHRCALELPAHDADDAKARLKSLYYGRIDGEMVAKVPALLGPVARVFCSVRNALAGS